MLHWSIVVVKDGARVAEFSLPSAVEKFVVVDLMRLLAAKGLAFSEIFACIWNRPHARVTLLDAQQQDEGRTLTCGNGVVKVYARQMWKPTEPDRQM